MNRSGSLGFFLICLGLIAFVNLSCGDNPPRKDGSVDTKIDTTVDVSPWPDQSTHDTKKADQYVWPDTGPKDTWPTPKDTYSSAPFGCESDLDCFGQNCCPTQWGVKLCAPTCPNLP